MTPRVSWGTALGDLAASMQPGTWAELTTLNACQALCDSVSGGDGHILIYAEGMKWDPVGKKVYFFGSDDPGDGSRLVTYTEATNSWDIVPEAGTFYAGTNVGHGYDLTSLNVTGRALYRANVNNHPWYKYDLSAGTWSLMPEPPSGPSDGAESFEYFPEMNAVISVRMGSVFKFNVATSQWSTLATGLNTDYHSFAEYNPIHKVILFGFETSLYKLDSTGKVTLLNAPPFSISTPNTEITYDPVSGIYLVYRWNKTWYTYNIATDTWALQPNTGVPTLLWTDQDNPNHFSSLAAPISTYGVIMFTRCAVSSGAGPCKVFLFKNAPDTTPPTSPKNVTIK
jgi:hypothetical protein